MAPQTTTIEKGTVTLPKELWANWQNASVIIQLQSDRKIIIEKNPAQNNNFLRMWKKAAGILKNRKIPDPLLWQNKIRKEWGR
ncbi:hypothetical protein COT68_01615 [bacterium (Candidatus Torokbacteria) CG09_land_8_20_14_0_10_42_11]|nr:MAG: hypothetical protein COT68_01615 [bacterium (Candidatus Torokbacteria) CG09_land_8_20_14_0_10_42_11]